MIRLILLVYYRKQLEKRLLVRGRTKYFMDFYITCCIYLLSQRRCNLFTYRKVAAKYAYRCIYE